jgi:RNA polymerase sigma factor (TIGR02999 family)
MTQTIGSAFEDAYPEMLRLARSRLAREHAPISTGTLVHEVYLGLRDRADLRFASRAQFLAYAGKAMRTLLVDMARERLASKRAADILPLTLAEHVADIGAGTPEQLLAMNEALDRLGQVDARLLRIAEMRAVLGMEVSDIARALEVSEPTVKRDWKRARAFLVDLLEPPP